jgi:hypothetical protein
LAERLEVIGKLADTLEVEPAEVEPAEFFEAAAEARRARQADLRLVFSPDAYTSSGAVQQRVLTSCPGSLVMVQHGAP